MSAPAPVHVEAFVTLAVAADEARAARLHRDATDARLKRIERECAQSLQAVLNMYGLTPYYKVMCQFLSEEVEVTAVQLLLALEVDPSQETTSPYRLQQLHKKLKTKGGHGPHKVLPAYVEDDDYEIPQRLALATNQLKQAAKEEISAMAKAVVHDVPTASLSTTPTYDSGSSADGNAALVNALAPRLNKEEKETARYAEAKVWLKAQHAREHDASLRSSKKAVTLFPKYEDGEIPVELPSYRKVVEAGCMINVVKGRECVLLSAKVALFALGYAYAGPAPTNVVETTKNEAVLVGNKDGATAGAVTQIASLSNAYLEEAIEVVEVDIAPLAPYRQKDYMHLFWVALIREVAMRKGATITVSFERVIREGPLVAAAKERNERQPTPPGNPRGNGQHQTGRGNGHQMPKNPGKRNPREIACKEWTRNGNAFCKKFLAGKCAFNHPDSRGFLGRFQAARRPSSNGNHPAGTSSDNAGDDENEEDKGAPGKRAKKD